jgi:hypothetical protein
MKSPIKLQNRDFKSTSYLKSIIPRGKIVHSYLFFDGTPEFQLAKENRFVVAHTNRYVVYEFWQCAIDDPRRIAAFASQLYPIGDEPIWDILQENWAKYKDPYLRSGIFFILNRCSDSGMIASGKLENSNFNPLAFSHLKSFSIKNFHIQHDESDDFLSSVDEIKDCDYVLIPAGQHKLNLLDEGMPTGLEETRVNHRKIKKWFDSTDKKCVLIYFKNSNVFRNYKNHNLTMIDKWGRVTSDKDKCEEIVIANF